MVKRISKLKGGTFECFVLDLSQKQSIDQFAKNVKVYDYQIQNNFYVIDILINNASTIANKVVGK